MRFLLTIGVVAITALICAHCQGARNKAEAEAKEIACDSELNAQLHALDSAEMAKHYAATTASDSSMITCPKCGFTKTEKLPTDVCQLKYTCTKCDTILFPKKGDCCVFCTYGTHKCPSKQE